MIHANLKFVKEIALDDEIWPYVSDDSCKKEDYSPSKKNTYFRNGNEGFVSFHKMKKGVFEGHVAMKRGTKNALEFGKACLEEMGKRGAKVIYAGIPVDNRAAMLYVRRLGFVEVTKYEGVIQRGKKRIGATVMGYRYA